jgi:hypothetical protein
METGEIATAARTRKQLEEEELMRAVSSKKERR